MITRLYNPHDYLTVRQWFPRHGVEAVPEAILPKCGVVVEKDGQPMCAGWLYQDNSVGIAWLAWLVTNPDQPLFHVEQSLQHLLSAAETVVKDLGYGLVFTETNRPALGRFLQRQGFTPNHQAVQYFKRLT